jgi:hypothetical protein
MALYQPYIGKCVKIAVTGEGALEGVLADAGADYLVLYTNDRYLYVQLQHVHNLEELNEQTDFTGSFSRMPDTTTVFGLLSSSKQKYMEIGLGEHKSFHGRVIETAGDYMLFDTIKLGAVYIPFFHIKWFSPIVSLGFPVPVSPEPAEPLPDSWMKRLESAKGLIVVLNAGFRSEQAGYMQAVDNRLIDLIRPGHSAVVWNADHLKCLLIRG